MRLEDLMFTVPHEVQRVHDEIVNGTGQEPDVEVRENGRRVRMAVEHERVKMTIDYKLTGSRWTWSSSRLWVDGEQRPIMQTPAHFYRLWHDPDSNGHRRADPADDQPIEPYPLEDAPADLRHFIETLQARLDPSKATLLFGRVTTHGATLPVIRLDTENGVLTVQLRRTGPAWLPYAYRLVKDGYDLTEVSGGSFEDALRMLIGDHTGPIGAPAGGPKVGGSHAPERLTSVEVRKQSVMRI